MTIDKHDALDIQREQQSYTRCKECGYEKFDCHCACRRCGEANKYCECEEV